MFLKHNRIISGSSTFTYDDELESLPSRSATYEYTTRQEVWVL
jgi:hypothetical protein